MINNAKKPIIYAGQGVIQANACKLLAQLSEDGNIPGGLRCRLFFLSAADIRAIPPR